MRLGGSSWLCEWSSGGYEESSYSGLGRVEDMDYERLHIWIKAPSLGSI
jgi:hypothetical protein